MPDWAGAASGAASRALGSTKMPGFDPLSAGIDLFGNLAGAYMAGQEAKRERKFQEKMAKQARSYDVEDYAKRTAANAGLAAQLRPEFQYEQGLTPYMATLGQVLGQMLMKRGGKNLSKLGIDWSGLEKQMFADKGRKTKPEPAPTAPLPTGPPDDMYPPMQPPFNPGVPRAPKRPMFGKRRPLDDTYGRLAQQYGYNGPGMMGSPM